MHACMSVIIVGAIRAVVVMMTRHKPNFGAPDTMTQTAAAVTSSKSFFILTVVSVTVVGRGDCNSCDPGSFVIVLDLLIAMT